MIDRSSVFREISILPALFLIRYLIICFNKRISFKAVWPLLHLEINNIFLLLTRFIFMKIIPERSYNKRFSFNTNISLYHFSK